MIINLFGLARKQLLQTRLRTLFIVLGVAFGIGLLVSMLVLNGKMNAALQKQLYDQYGESDMMVGFRHTNQLLKQDQIKKIQQTDGVVDSALTLVNPQNFNKEYAGRPNGIYYLGTDNSQIAKSSYKFTHDLGPQEVAISQKLAQKLHANVADTVEIPFPSGKSQPWKIAEILPDHVGSGGAMPETVIFNLESLQDAFGLQGEVNLLWLKLAPGADKVSISHVLTDQISSQLDIDLENGMEQAKRNVQSMQYMGYGLGVMALLTSALFVLSSFQISVRERMRELAVLRSIGAKRGQVIRLVITETLIVDTLGTLFGLALGIMLATLFSSFVARLLQVPMINVSLPWKSLLGLSLVGWAFILLIGLVPAVRTMRIMPIQAARESMTEIYKSRKWPLLFSAVLVFLGLLAFVGSLFLSSDIGGPKALLSVVGGILMVLGFFWGSTFIIKPLLLVLSPFVQRIGGRVAFVAVKNLILQRKQSSMTILVIAIAVTLSLTVSSVFASLKTSSEAAIHREYVTDMVANSNLQMMSTLPYGIQKEIQRIPGVKDAIPVSTIQTAMLDQYDFTRSQPKWLAANSGTDPFSGQPMKNVLRFAMTDLNRLSLLGLIAPMNTPRDHAVVFSKQFAKDLGVQIGDQLHVTNGNRSTTLTVATIADAPPGTDADNQVLVDWSNQDLFDQTITVRNVLIQIDQNQLQNVKHGLDVLNNKYPELTYADLDQAMSDLQSQIGQRLAILYAVVIVVLIVGALGMINTLSANIHEKRREYAILRAISVTPKQLIKIVLTQSLLFGGVAVVFGVVTSFVLTYALSNALNHAMVVPWTTLVIMVLVVFVLLCFVSLPISYRLGRKSVTDELTAT